MNRYITGRKRIEGIWLSICLLLLFLTGCGEEPLQSGTNVQLEKDGGVTVTYVEDFPSDYYDLEELIQMNQKEVEAYNAKAGADTVKILSTETDGSTVTLSMHYQNIEDYGNMNGGSMYYGTILQGKEAGYDLDYPFTEASTGESMVRMDWENLKDHHLIIANGPTLDYQAVIHTYKKILYVTENVTVSEDGKSAVINGQEPAVIVFK